MNNVIILAPDTARDWVERYCTATLAHEIDNEVLQQILDLPNSPNVSLPEPDELQLWLTREQYTWVKTNNVFMVIDDANEFKIIFDTAENAAEFALRWL